MRSQKFNTHPPQLLPGRGRVVVTIPDDDPGARLNEFGDDRELVDIGRSYRETGDHPRPADPQMHSEAIESLLEERVLAESGLAPEA
jgi:hypothetical protein